MFTFKKDGYEDFTAEEIAERLSFDDFKDLLDLLDCYSYVEGEQLLYDIDDWVQEQIEAIQEQDD